MYKDSAAKVVKRSLLVALEHRPREAEDSRCNLVGLAVDNLCAFGTN
jgi:hypothetical protein